MLEQLMKLYVMSMATGVTSPLAHIVGPPGSGKSSMVYQLGELIGVNVHTINLARISPLEIEGVQMPVEDNTKLQLLHSTMWKQIEEGDIVLYDECLRAFPEVFDALLDILTSREVAGYKLPRAFFIGASNSVTSYDKALEDRLLHLPVPDVRTSKKAQHTAKVMLIDTLGLLPEMAESFEMGELLSKEVYPMYDMLDQFKGKGMQAGKALVDGHSIRNLIGQALMRQVNSDYLAELIHENNRRAIAAAKYQFVFLLDGANVNPRYLANYESLPLDKLTPVQLQVLQLNKQLLELEQLKEEEGATPDGDDTSDIFA